MYPRRGRILRAYWIVMNRSLITLFLPGSLARQSVRTWAMLLACSVCLILSASAWADQTESSGYQGQRSNDTSQTSNVAYNSNAEVPADPQDNTSSIYYELAKNIPVDAHFFKTQSNKQDSLLLDGRTSQTNRASNKSQDANSGRVTTGTTRSRTSRATSRDTRDTNVRLAAYEMEGYPQTSLKKYPSRLSRYRSGSSMDQAAYVASTEGDVSIDGQGPPNYVGPVYDGDPCQPSCDGPLCCDTPLDPYCVGQLGWFRGELLIWWIKGFSVPPLVTTSPTGTPREDAGVLDDLRTTILFGGTSLETDDYTGGRVRLGYWFDPDQTYGIEAGYFGFGEEISTFSASSSGDVILARPFYNVEPDFIGYDAELVAFPDEFQGSVYVRGATELQGVEVLYRHALMRDCSARIDLVAGYRFQRLDEDLLISDSKQVLGGEGGFVVGTTIEEYDHFLTKNRFNGAELGIVGQWERCGWSLELLMKLGLGNTNSNVGINGETVVTVPIDDAPPAVAITHAGLLAQQTNIGTYDRDQFTVIPELGITLGCYISPRLRFTVGYSFIYWCGVARPGDQIDTQLNLSQLDPEGLVGIPRPAFTWVKSDVWAQGVNLGLEYRY